MITSEDVRSVYDQGGAVKDTSGAKIGQIYLDDETGVPEWVTVKTGLFGSGESFVPLAEASLDGDDITVPYGKDQVTDAPRVTDSDTHLDEAQEAEFYAFYGLSSSRTATPRQDDTELPDDSSQDEHVVGRDTSGPTTDRAMTRSEEQLHIGTETVEAGRARLRKYVVTENVTRTVPVSHEEVRLVREPVTEGNRDSALAGAELTSEEHEVTLTQEKVVVSKETVPVGRVRLATEAVTEDTQAQETVGKEQIEYDDSSLPARNDSQDS